MNNIVMPREEAEKTGARHFFGEKYGDQISIYFIGKDLANAYSKEFCGGPHVKNTSELAGPEGKWRFKIQKEEAVSQGVRRKSSFSPVPLVKHPMWWKKKCLHLPIVVNAHLLYARKAPQGLFDTLLRITWL
jgi:alanyl-tRNA synthetase